MTRLAALGERLESPLLVTNLTNVFYLCGFDSSNAALLVQPGGETTLYTDFRYSEAAQSVAGVTVEMTKRALTIDVGAKLKGTVQFVGTAPPVRKLPVTVDQFVCGKDKSAEDLCLRVPCPVLVISSTGSSSTSSTRQREGRCPPGCGHEA